MKPKKYKKKTFLGIYERGEKMQHTFLGFSINEWFGLLGIFTAIVTGVGQIFNRTLNRALDKTMQPLRYAIDNLSKTIQALKNDNSAQQIEVRNLGKSFENHLIDSQEIKTKVINLEKEVFRRGGHND